MHPSVRLRSLLPLSSVALSLSLLAACTGGPTTDPSRAPVADPVNRTAQAVDLRVIGPSTVRPVDIGDPSEVPWSLYLEVSRTAGLEFAPLAGRRGDLWSAPIESSEPGTTLYALVVEDVVVGAWAAGQQTSGVWAITAVP